eukprot:CAMPEP_0119563324 /NCGR_PEP_ID=MMETSP1352-20130426/23034_1 /TAXON_ID=265584 /ORGANISM="Stauroneis constricta, Strain CCMP1120" /LENGTH=109 /DNA_ID=CAMNT_0007611893 /DNA_START=100 /DNA_END=426 /DNA_ORIENTATION=+
MTQQQHSTTTTAPTALPPTPRPPAADTTLTQMPTTAKKATAKKATTKKSSASATRKNRDLPRMDRQIAPVSIGRDAIISQHTFLVEVHSTLCDHIDDTESCRRVVGNAI